MTPLTPAKRPLNGHLTQDERDRAMLVLALNGGHCQRTATQLADEDLPVTDRQLLTYRNSPRYEAIRKNQAAEIERSLLDEYKNAARRSLKLHELATEQAITKVDDLKDPAKAAQNAAIASGVMIDKALLIEGRPTVITGSTDIRQDIQAIARQMGFDANSTAEEITEASQVEAPA